MSALMAFVIVTVAATFIVASSSVLLYALGGVIRTEEIAVDVLRYWVGSPRRPCRRSPRARPTGSR